MRLARIFALAAGVLMVLGTSQRAFAQTTGAVVGTVADAQGATVPGATVTLISQSRGIAIDTQIGRHRRLHFPERAA